MSYCALELSHEDQSWWKGCYADDGVAASQTTYFHNDHSFNVPKAMLYLSDVDEEQGPFCFVPKSHRWKRSVAGTLLIKTLDRAHDQAWAARNKGTGYYRPQFQNAEFREAFMKLPQPLRATSHFGDDVLDGTALSEQILGQQKIGLTREANCIVFDGGTGVHRGGLVRQGRRYALQIGFRERNKHSPGQRLEKFFRKHVRRRLGSLLGTSRERN